MIPTLGRPPSETKKATHLGRPHLACYAASCLARTRPSEGEDDLRTEARRARPNRSGSGRFGEDHLWVECVQHGSPWVGAAGQDRAKERPAQGLRRTIGGLYLRVARIISCEVRARISPQRRGRSGPGILPGQSNRGPAGGSRPAPHDKSVLDRTGAVSGCLFCQRSTGTVDYKDVDSLRSVLKPNGTIRPRRGTRGRLCRKHQSQFAIAVKRARLLGLLPNEPAPRVVPWPPKGRRGL